MEALHAERIGNRHRNEEIVNQVNPAEDGGSFKSSSALLEKPDDEESTSHLSRGNHEEAETPKFLLGTSKKLPVVQRASSSQHASFKFRGTAVSGANERLTALQKKANDRAKGKQPPSLSPNLAQGDAHILEIRRQSLEMRGGSYGQPTFVSGEPTYHQRHHHNYGHRGGRKESIFSPDASKRLFRTSFRSSQQIFSLSPNLYLMM